MEDSRTQAARTHFDHVLLDVACGTGAALREGRSFAFVRAQKADRWASSIRTT